MQAHEQVEGLGRRRGPGVFEDHEELRDALGPLIDAGALSPGEASLLVDAVRVGALRSLVGALDAGADVTGAVDAAGAGLARERGSADRTGSAWACAVLGYAVGRVGGQDVRAALDRRSAERPADQQPSWDQPSWDQPAAAPASYEQPTYGRPWEPVAPVVPARQTARKRRTAVALASVGALVVVLGATAAGILLLRDGDGGDETDTTGGTTTTSGEVDPDAALTVEAVAERYAPLGADLADLLDECEAGEPAPAQDEEVVCTLTDAGDEEVVGARTVTLTTYSSGSGLEDARDALVTHGIGTRWSEQDEGVFWSVRDDGTKDVAVYWEAADDLQVGVLRDAARGSRTVDEADLALEALHATFVDTGSALDLPTGVEHPDLQAFAQATDRPEVPNLLGCAERIQNLDPDELEENVCRATDAGMNIYFVRSVDQRALTAFRSARVQNAQADPENGGQDVWHYGATPTITEGPMVWYTATNASGGTGAYLYWEETECLCYGFAVRQDGDLERLRAWWRG